MTPESKLLAAVTRYLRSLKASGVPIEWTKSAGSPMQKRGLPDLLVIISGPGRCRAIFIELKAPGRKPTRLQAEMLKRLRAAGATAVVCYSVAEVRELIEA